MRSFSIKAFTTIELLVIVVAFVIFGTASVVMWKEKVAPTPAPPLTPTPQVQSTPTTSPGVGEEVQTGSQCSRESGIDTCPQGYLCYWSWECPKGVQDCGPPTGDFLCHKKCQTDSDCPRDMPFCKEVPLFRGDYGNFYWMCMK